MLNFYDNFASFQNILFFKSNAKYLWLSTDQTYANTKIKNCLNYLVVK